MAAACHTVTENVHISVLPPLPSKAIEPMLRMDDHEVYKKVDAFVDAMILSTAPHPSVSSKKPPKPSIGEQRLPSAYGEQSASLSPSFPRKGEKREKGEQRDEKEKENKENEEDEDREEKEDENDEDPDEDDKEEEEKLCEEEEAWIDRGTDNEEDLEKDDVRLMVDPLTSKAFFQTSHHASRASSFLSVACASGRPDEVQSLLSVYGKGLATHPEALKTATAYGHLDVVVLLIGQGACPLYGIVSACEKGHQAILHYLVACSTASTSFMTSATSTTCTSNKSDFCADDETIDNATDDDDLRRALWEGFRAACRSGQGGMVVHMMQSYAPYLCTTREEKEEQEERRSDHRRESKDNGDKEENGDKEDKEDKEEEEEPTKKKTRRIERSASSVCLLRDDVEMPAWWNSSTLSTLSEALKGAGK